MKRHNYPNIFLIILIASTSSASSSGCFLAGLFFRFSCCEVTREGPLAGGCLICGTTQTLEVIYIQLYFNRQIGKKTEPLRIYKIVTSGKKSCLRSGHRLPWSLFSLERFLQLPPSVQGLFLGRLLRSGNIRLVHNKGGILCTWWGTSSLWRIIVSLRG